MSQNLSIELLNHASLLIQAGPVSLLTDPWFNGPCFRGTWGLRYVNPDAMDRASTATHLWVSHPHSDHLHPPTLHALAKKNSQMQVLANHSHNFQLAETFRKSGFQNIVDFYERREVSIAADFRVMRIPATGMDNMMVMRAQGMTLVNYNDCNLPAPALKMLVRRLGKIDVLFTNFNHAAKILEDLTPEQVMANQRAHFRKVVEFFNPTWTIPFASLHFYRSPYSKEQNLSLLQTTDLVELHPSVRALQVGDRASIRPDWIEVIRRNPPLEPVPFDVKSSGESVPIAKLQESVAHYCKTLQPGFFHLGGWIPSLTIRIDDLKTVLRIHSSGRAEEFPYETPADISSHSRSLYEWFSSEFGTDVLTVGGEFQLLNQDKKALRRWFLAGLLTENKLTPKDALMSLIRPSAWSFLLNRREEIAGLIMRGKIRGGEPRL